MSTPSSAGEPAASECLLFVADVVGRPGRRALTTWLPALRREYDVSFCIVNGENAADGAGMTKPIVASFFECGADVVTSGNHVFGNKDIFRVIDDETRLLRPLNMAAGVPGRGAGVFRTSRGTPVLVMNALGRVFMDPAECPFRAVDATLETDGLGAGDGAPSVRLLDFHAEATSETIAMSWHLDGRVTAVIGTHTHVPTADERVSERGTAAITDAGMTGPHRSVIGMKTDAVLRRMVRGLPTRFSTATGDVRLNGVLIWIDPDSGKATRIERVERRQEDA